MTGSEPMVERKVLFTIITFEVAVMQLMEKRTCRNLFGSLDLERFEPYVTLCRGERCMLCIHQHMDRV